MTITEAQTKFITALPSISAGLSMIGSSIIVFMITTKRHVGNPTYTRLMLGICIFDLLGGFWTMLGRIPVPTSEGGRGNTASCAAQGFFMYFGTEGMLGYNCSLMLYYVMSLVFEWTEKPISRLEPYLHTFSIGYTSLINVSGLFLTVYNAAPYGHRCGFNAYPFNCDVTDDVTCERGEHSRFFVSNFVAIPSMLCLSFLLGCLLFIFAALKWRRHKQHVIAARNINDLEIDGESSSVAMTTAVGCSGRKQARKDKHLSAVAIQSRIYAIVFINTYFWVFLRFYLRIHGFDKNENAMYAIRVLAEFFLPFQGFLNMLIFIRLRYQRLRDQQRSKGRLWAFQECVFGIPTSSRNQQCHRSMRSAGKSLEIQIHDAILPQDGTCHPSTQNEPPGSTRTDATAHLEHSLEDNTQ